ncbi:MAG: Nif11-like leader peptide family natural product precursor [Cyanobacteria bacterium P01_G01_bin.49]
MSLENVRAFYERLAEDVEFRSELQEVKTKEECSQFVQEAGYDFTQEEFETYTSHLLESSQADGELKDLDKQELEAVFGGVSSAFLPIIPVLLYGVVFLGDQL